MNPCDFFKPPEMKVNTETEVHGSCNCCRDNRYESECGCCCFPFLRRRRCSEERDEKIQHIFDDVVKIKEEIHEKVEEKELGKFRNGKKVKRVKVRRSHKNDETLKNDHKARF